MKKEDAVRSYFQSWIKQDRRNYDELFEENVVYRECYGPEYHGLSQIKKWFDDWNQNGKVLQWSIKQMIVEEMTVVAEWYFECNYHNDVNGFDGCSIIAFSQAGKMTSVKEFQSKAEHCFPYGQ